MLKNINRNTKYFFISTITISIAVMGVFFTFAGILIRENGYLEGFIGRTLSITTLPIALASVLSSYLIKNYGYKKIIILGIILISAGLMGFGLTSEKIPLTISAILIGMGFSMHLTSEGAFLTSNNSEERRVKIFSYNFTLRNIGLIIGSLLGGILSDVISPVTSKSFSLKILFLISAVLLLSTICPISKITENKTTEKKIGMKDYWSSYKKVVRGKVVLFILYNSTIGLGAGLVVPFFSVYLKYALDIENSLVGMILSIAQMGCVFAGLMVPFLVKKFGRTKTVMMTQILSIPFLISIAFPQGIILITISFLMRSTLMNLNSPINQNLSMEMVDADERPILSSIFSLSSNFTRATGVAAGGYLMENFSYNTPYYLL